MDAAALRTAVALRVIRDDVGRLSLPVEQLNELVDAWDFLSVLLLVCENDDHDPYEELRRVNSGAGSSVAWQNDGSDAVGAAGSSSGGGTAPGASSVAGGSNDQNQPLLQAAFTGGSGGGGQTPLTNDAPLVNAQWLEAHPAVVCAAMAPLVDQVRSAMDLVGDGFDGAGVTLGDAFCDNPGDPREALQCLLANLQVWGSYGAELLLDSCDGGSGSSTAGASGCAGGDPPGEDEEPMLAATGEHSDFYLECFLGRCSTSARGSSAPSMSHLEATIKPEMLSNYHRRLSRERVVKVWKEFRRRLAGIRRLANTLLSDAAAPGTTGSGTAGGAQQGPEDVASKAGVIRSVLRHLDIVEGSISAVARHFKSLDLAPAATTEKPGLSPSLDHAAIGYVMHVECGHNGALDEASLRQLSLHVLAAGVSPPPANPAPVA